MIKTENLGRYFGDIKAVDGISFSAEKGEVLGFLGPNGAGKSTTMKMLTCFLTPSFGSATVAGFDVVEQGFEVRKRVGYLPENAPLYEEMSVKQFLSFIAEARNVQRKEISKSVERVVDLTSLSSVYGQKIETLSKGFKRRVGLAQALIHDPEILILDEPTDGLDPNQKHDVRCLISSMAEDKCIVLSTHILEEVEAVCSRAVIISKGKIVADETPQELKRRSKTFGAVTIQFASEVPEKYEEVLNGLDKVSGCFKDEESGQRVTVQGNNGTSKDLLLQVVDVVKQSDWQIDDIHVESGNLNDVFREITK